MILRLTFALLFAAIHAVPASAAWVKVESPHFIGYSDGTPEDLKLDIVQLEQYDALLRSRLNINAVGSPIKLSVFKIRNVKTVAKLLGDPGAAGYYATSNEGPLAVVPRVPGGGGKFGLRSDTILFHEYAHHVMYQHFNAAYPFWYSEGFAEFMSTTEFDIAGKAKLGLGARHRAYALARGGYIPIEVLLGRNPKELGNYSGDTVYALSWLLTHYLNFSKERRGQLKIYLDLMATGASSVKAAEQAFGDLTELGNELYRYRSRTSIPYIEIDVKPLDAVDLQISTLSPGVGEAMLHRIIMMGGTQLKKADARASALRKIAADHPDDADVQALLAQAEFGVGAWSASVSAADAALKINSGSVRAMLWKGEAMQMQLLAEKNKDGAKWNAARSLIIKANRANPDSAAPLAAYYRSFVREGREANEAALTGLAKAMQLIPQDDDIRLQYVFALARKQKFNEALEVIRILSDAPHAGKRIAAIRDFAAQLGAAKSGTAIEGLDALEQSIEALKLI
jgi:tetratricopeptide (TPR) repeat protein